MTEALDIQIVRPADAQHRLTARIDPSSNFLLLESKGPHSWPYGGTIDGLVTLDLDDERCLSHVEVMAPRGRWRTGDFEPPMHSEEDGCLRLPYLTREAIPQLLTAAVLLTGPSVVVRFGDVATSRRVPIGSGIDALVSGDALAGFLISEASIASSE